MVVSRAVFKPREEAFEMRSSYLSMAFLMAASPVLGSDLLRTVTVSGTGKVEVTPDVARVSYSVINTGNLTKTVPQLVRENKQRVNPTVEYVKEVVGTDGTVTALPSIQQVYEYNQATRKTELKGYQIVTQIQVELKGEAAIEQKLGKLFDTSKVQADNISQPVLALSDERQEAATTEAYKKAVQNAVKVAEAQLEPGEQLGSALQRGHRIEVPSPRRPQLEMARSAMAEAPGGAPDAGQAVLETGKVAVHAFTNFVFEVTGTALRILNGQQQKPGTN